MMVLVIIPAEPRMSEAKETWQGMHFLSQCIAWPRERLCGEARVSAQPR